MQNKEVLIDRFLARTISRSERKALKKWVLQNKGNLEFFKEEIRKRSKNTLYHHFDEGEAFKKFLTLVDQKRSKSVIPQSLLKYTAIFIGLVSLGLVTHQGLAYLQQPENSIVNTKKADKDQLNNVVVSLADGTKRTITADGSTELFDKNGNIIAKKQEQGLDFRSIASNLNKRLVFNEVYVPYGQTFTITLSDGTKVWLNAGSRLRFPQNLNATTQNRTVYLEGEAYFDVTKDAKRPFIVNVENLDIKVLGTQFNVSAYKSDSSIATTLVEGSVNVYENSNPGTEVVLTPNYQASFSKENGALTSQKVNTHMYTSWMKNVLIIDNLSFEQILNKLERLYNVSIINNAESLKNEVYKGEFESELLETVLNTIASSTPFTYTIENNIITISK